jgi:hypothetical protein
MLALSGPIANGLNILAGTIGIIIAFDLFMVAALGTVEAIIERISGDSATFHNGKMITMRRAEMLAQRAEAYRRRPEREAKTGTAGPPSVYRLSLPIPGAPGKESVSATDKVIIEPEAKPAPPPSPTTSSRAGPAMITGTAEKPAPTRPETAKSLPPSATLNPKPDEPQTEDESGADEITYEDVDESA